jgi:hypothetical protein
MRCIESTQARGPGLHRLKCWQWFQSVGLACLGGLLATCIADRRSWWLVAGLHLCLYFRRQFITKVWFVGTYNMCSQGASRE